MPRTTGLGGTGEVRCGGQTFAVRERLALEREEGEGWPALSVAARTAALVLRAPAQLLSFMSHSTTPLADLRPDIHRRRPESVRGNRCITEPTVQDVGTASITGLPGAVTEERDEPIKREWLLPLHLLEGGGKSEGLGALLPFTATP